MPERRPRIPEDLADRIDELRGDVPFERFVRRTLEAALGEEAPVRASRVEGLPNDAPPVSPRAPTARQLAGRNGVPTATATQWLKSDEWRRYW